MKSFSFKHIALLFFSLLCLATCGVFGVLFLQTYRQYNTFKEKSLQYEEKLAKTEAQVKAYESYLNKIFNDPDFFEHVARSRLGYSKPNELIFKFESPTTNN